jgi:hypothetical protein
MLVMVGIGVANCQLLLKGGGDIHLVVPLLLVPKLLG